MSPIPSLRKLTPKARRDLLIAKFDLSDDEAQYLERSSLGYWSSLFDDVGMGENIFSAFPLPLGLATNFVVNGNPVAVPMAIEERSVVAAASKAAKLCLPEGFKATVEVSQTVAKAQILYTELENTGHVYNEIISQQALVTNLKEMYNPLLKYGGDISHITAQPINISATTTFLVVTVTANAAEAAGPMVMVRIAEHLAEILLPLTKKRPIAIMPDNDAQGRTVTARASWPIELIGADVAKGILALQDLAAHNVARAFTHNKGIMNGIDAVAVATGQDWRAVEAAAQAKATTTVVPARTSTQAGYKFGEGDEPRRDTGKRHYMPLTTYRKEGDRIVGALTVGLSIGTVGGATAHPMAALCRKIMGVTNVNELAAVMGAVGLAQNFAALRCLADEGLTGAHQRLKR